MGLARNLRRAREAAELSREVLAVKAGISSATVVRIESYGHSPTLRVVEALATALGVTVSSLFAEENDALAIASTREPDEPKAVNS